MPRKGGDVGDVSVISYASVVCHYYHWKHSRAYKRWARQWKQMQHRSNLRDRSKLPRRRQHQVAAARLKALAGDVEDGVTAGSGSGAGAATDKRSSKRRASNGTGVGEAYSLPLEGSSGRGRSGGGSGGRSGRSGRGRGQVSWYATKPEHPPRDPGQVGWAMASGVKYCSVERHRFVRL